MKAEKFYKQVQNKLDGTDFAPTWNQGDVWQRIEQRNAKKITPFIWWTSVAASLVLMSLFGGYFLLKDNTNIVANQPKENAPKSTQTIASKSLVPTASAQESTQPSLANLIRTNKPKKTNNINTPVSEQPVIAQITEPTPENNPKVEEQEIITAPENAAPSNETLVTQNLILPMPVLFNQRKAPAKRERVAILEIPDNEEDYLIAPEKKKGRIARMAKRQEKTNTSNGLVEPNRPNKLWAFVKESFKNETMATDSTQR